MRTPSLNPMPGRVVVELVDRLERFPEHSKWAKLVHRPDLDRGEIDQRHQHQPYAGRVVAFGEPEDDRDTSILAEAVKRSDNGELWVFSWGSGTNYAGNTEHFLMMERPDGEPRFGWLMNLRLFRIKDLVCSIKGGDAFGGSEEDQDAN